MTGIERLRDFARHMKDFSVWPGGQKLLDIADQIEREQRHDQASDVSVSTYDLLPDEEREAVAWVRKHGGLDAVRSEWSSCVPYDKHEQRRQRLLGHIAECETALRRRNERIKELGHRVSDLETENAELRRKAMPEDYEWPRYEDGKPVRFGDELPEFSNTIYKDVKQIKFRSNGCVVIDNAGGSAERELVLWNNERVKRPAPKVLDADGVEIRVGDTVWATNGHGPFEVTRTVYADRLRVICDDEENGHLNAYPEMLTHERPVLDADGVPIKVGDTVYFTDGREQECNTVVYAEYDYKDEPYVQLGRLNDVGYPTYTNCSCIDPSQLTHTKPEPPDSWERLEEDANKNPFDYCKDVGHTCENSEAYKAHDLVRRAKALAGDA